MCSDRLCPVQGGQEAMRVTSAFHFSPEYTIFKLSLIVLSVVLPLHIIVRSKNESSLKSST